MSQDLAKSIIGTRRLILRPLRESDAAAMIFPKTGAHPASSAGQAFSGSCAKKNRTAVGPPGCVTADAEV